MIKNHNIFEKENLFEKENSFEKMYKNKEKLKESVNNNKDRIYEIIDQAELSFIMATENATVLVGDPIMICGTLACIVTKLKELGIPTEMIKDSVDMALDLKKKKYDKDNLNSLIEKLVDLKKAMDKFED